MRKFKRWLIDKFLPAWCREELLKENAELRDKCASQQHTIDTLRAYINGMERYLRGRTRIYINSTETGGRT